MSALVTARVSKRGPRHSRAAAKWLWHSVLRHGTCASGRSGGRRGLLGPKSRPKPLRFGRLVGALHRRARSRPARARAQALPRDCRRGRYRGPPLADSSVDAVALATPPRTHHELASRAIERGKHVLVEKPLAETFRDAEDLCAKAQRAGVRLMTDHTFLYTGAVEKLRSLRAGGDLGKVYYIDSARANLGLFQQSNVVWDLAPHDVSIHQLHSRRGRRSRWPCSSARAFTRRRAGRRVSDDVVSERDCSGARAFELALTGEGAAHDGLRKPARWRFGTTYEPTEKVYVYDKGVVLGPVELVAAAADGLVPLGTICTFRWSTIARRSGKLVSRLCRRAITEMARRRARTVSFGAGVVRVIEAALALGRVWAGSESTRVMPGAASGAVFRDACRRSTKRRGFPPCSTPLRANVTLGNASRC